jgi:enamine deaminase RidA (YjgF/YER057c/UK114 family)
MPEDVTEQTDNIFKIALAVLEGQGLNWSDVVRHRVFVTDGEYIGKIAQALKSRFENCPPANTTLICGIPAPGAKVEIEFTARLRE